MKIFVPGGAGYKGAVLVPKLLARGHEVVVYDLYIYDKEVFKFLPATNNLTEVRGDVRDFRRMENAAQGCDATIHLACISNDPTCDLDPTLARSINCESFPAQVEAIRQAGVRGFIFASSASIYGISDEPDVREDHPLVPVSDYNRYKAVCEDVLQSAARDNFKIVVIRPATVCGCSPRLRLDLVVNMFTAQAHNTGKIRVFGGEQFRPNIHIDDITDLYCQMIDREPAENYEVFNAGWQNMSILHLAQQVKLVSELFVDGREVEIEIVPSNDVRSYRVNSDKLTKITGFVPRRTILDAISELRRALIDGEYPGSSISSRYYNIKRMQEIGLK